MVPDPAGRFRRGRRDEPGHDARVQPVASSSLGLGPRIRPCGTGWARRRGLVRQRRSEALNSSNGFDRHPRPTMKASATSRNGLSSTSERPSRRSASKRRVDRLVFGRPARRRRRAPSTSSRLPPVGRARRRARFASRSRCPRSAARSGASRTPRAGSRPSRPAPKSRSAAIGASLVRRELGGRAAARRAARAGCG